MLTMAGQSVRAYPIRFAGTFVALTLGIALMAGSGLVIAAPGPVTDAQAYAETTALLRIMAGISAFAAMFVVAGTCALGIQQRRRELALLRLVGATPGQVRRLLTGEVALVGLAASVAGGALALPVAHGALAFLRWLDVIVPAMTVSLQPGPLAAAAGIGTGVALVGVRVASRRTRRIRPVEALRQAAIEQRPMTFLRWVVGLLAGAGGVVMLGAMAAANASDRLGIALLVGEVLVVGATALAPVIVAPLVRLVGMAVRHSATAGVAQATLWTQARRTASVAAPIMLITGIAGSVLAATSSLQRTVVNEERARIATEIIMVPSGEPGISAATIEQASTVDGVAAVAPIGSTHVFAPDEYSTHVIPTAAISSGAMRFDVHEGDMSALTGDSFAASHTFAADHGWQLGDVVPMRLDDGSGASLRLVATVDGGISGGYVFVPADRLDGHLEPSSIQYALVTVEPGVDPVAVRQALATQGVVAVDRDEWLARLERAGSEGIGIGLAAVLGMAGLYAAIAIVNTLVMAARARAQDLAQMRLAGATRGQALRTLAWEGGLVALIGITLGGLVTVTTLVSMQVSLRAISTVAQADLPLPTLGLIASGCALLVLVASLVTGAFAVRRPALQTLAIPE